MWLIKINLSIPFLNPEGWLPIFGSHPSFSLVIPHEKPRSFRLVTKLLFVVIEL